MPCRILSCSNLIVELSVSFAWGLSTPGQAVCSLGGASRTSVTYPLQEEIAQVSIVVAVPVARFL